MRAELIEKLRIAANQFYLNKYLDHPMMPDSEYDSLASEYEAEGGSVFNLVEWYDDIRRPNNPLPKVDKDIIYDNNLTKAVSEYLTRRALASKFTIYNHYINYKYDGSSIIAYYTPEGKLHHILGTPDCELCMDRTKNCWNMFPHQINPGIECIQGEFLVDANQYGQLARNKANGLLNSKDMIEELQEEGFIRVYQMRFYDDNWSYDRLRKELSNLPLIYITRSRGGNESLDLVFSPAESLTLCPTDAIIEESIKFTTCDNITRISNPKFQVDGVVIYDTLGYHALKFYYTDYADTTVKSIEWNRQYNGSLIPKIIIEGITINGKNIGQVASGGVSNMVNNRIGKGAKVRVILSGLTIPKIISVIEPSDDFEWPTCECGHKYSLDDLFGGGVKCQGEYVCSARYSMWSKEVLRRFEVDNPNNLTRYDWLRENLIISLQVTLNIDRVDINKFHVSDEWKECMFNNIIDGNADTMKSLMDQYLPGGLGHDIVGRNYITAYSVLHDFINYNI